MPRDKNNLAGDPTIMELAARLAIAEARLQSLEDEGDAFQEDQIGAVRKELGDGEYPDSVSILAGHVATVGFNPTADDHLGELGLWDSWGTWSAAAGQTIPKIPYLPKDQADEGDLAWCAPDADSTGYGSGGSRSVQILSNVLQMYGFAAAAEGAIDYKKGTYLTWTAGPTDQHVPYWDQATTTLKLGYIVQFETNPWVTGSGSGPGTTERFQILVGPNTGAGTGWRAVLSGTTLQIFHAHRKAYIADGRLDISILQDETRQDVDLSSLSGSGPAGPTGPQGPPGSDGDPGTWWTGLGFGYTGTFYGMDSAMNLVLVTCNNGKVNSVTAT